MLAAPLSLRGRGSGLHISDQYSCVVVSKLRGSRDGDPLGARGSQRPSLRSRQRLPVINSRTLGSVSVHLSTGLTEERQEMLKYAGEITFYSIIKNKKRLLGFGNVLKLLIYRRGQHSKIKCILLKIKPFVSIN